MKVEKLKEDIANGKYNQVQHVKPKYLSEVMVIDETKSCEWNREEVLRLNKLMTEKINKYRVEVEKQELKLKEAIIHAYSHRTGYGDGKIEVIFNYAYDISHSKGINEILNTLDSLLELISTVTNRKTNV